MYYVWIYSWFESDVKMLKDDYLEEAWPPIYTQIYGIIWKARDVIQVIGKTFGWSIETS
jgi:hypothetical protein